MIITKQTGLIQWSDLELTANPGDTLADIEKPAYLVSPLDGKQIPGTFYWIDAESTSVGELGDRTGFKFRFVPDMPLSAELAALYDFSTMPEDGFQGDEWNPYTAYVTVKEESEIPGGSDPIDLPVRVLEDEGSGYVSRPDLTAAFTPDTAVTVGEFNEYQGLAIDYYNPMVDAELSEGYDIQAGYTVSIPLTGYAGETLSGTLTIPLPEGYDGATARIKGGASASSYTATTVTFPLTLDVSGGTAEAFELLIEYREAQEPVQPPVIIAGANGSWQKGGTDGLSFTSNAAFADFIKVQVDGKDLDASNYTVKEGSTIVTLNAAYLNTLSVGKHTLSVVSANGTATTEFTITAAPTGGDDQTGGSDQTGSDTTPQRPDRNGGGGSSSSYREREYDFWMDVRDEIRHADPGDTVKANARTYDRMPRSVMEALSEADGVTLHITWNGGEDIIIPSEAALSERNRVYYPLSYLEEMTFEVEPEVPAADLDKNEGAVTNPQTGASSNAVLWIALLFASGVGLMGAAVYSRKKDTANNQ